MSVRKRFHANIGKSDLPTVNLEWNMTQKLDPTLEPSNYKQLPNIRTFSAENSTCPRRFIRDGPELLQTCSTCMFYMYVHPETLPPGGAFYFRRIYLVVRIRAYMSRRRVPNHKSVWELHTSATPPPLLLLSIESTTNLVGHNIFTSIRHRHKNINF